MTQGNQTAEEALAAVMDQDGDPVGSHAVFTCPYPECSIYAQHKWGSVNSLQIYGGSQNTRRLSPGNSIVAAQCTACDRETIFFRGKMVVPAVTQAPLPSPDLPEDLADNFEEARRVLPISPRGSAAILRLVVEKLLPKIGADEDDINKMIGQLVAKGTISPIIQQALDSVRVIGNEYVHPGTMDLKDNLETATTLFRLINFIVEKAITEPKEVAAIFDGLPPNKRQGIANRDKPKAKPKL